MVFITKQVRISKHNTLSNMHGLLVVLLPFICLIICSLSQLLIPTPILAMGCISTAPNLNLHMCKPSLPSTMIQLNYHGKYINKQQRYVDIASVQNTHVRHVLIKVKQMYKEECMMHVACALHLIISLPIVLSLLIPMQNVCCVKHQNTRSKHALCIMVYIHVSTKTNNMSNPVQQPGPSPYMHLALAPSPP